MCIFGNITISLITNDHLKLHDNGFQLLSVYMGALVVA